MGTYEFEAIIRVTVEADDVFQADDVVSEMLKSVASDVIDTREV